MKFHKLRMVGKYWMQTIPSGLPVWTSDDEARLIYNELDEKVYHGTSTGWVELGSGGGGGGGTVISREEFTSTDDQTVFPLTFHYTVGDNGLMVYANNVLMIKNVDYYETNSNTITFATGRALNEEVTAIYVNTQTSIQRLEVSSTLDQTVFNLPFSYVPGSNELLVFSNNIMMIAGGEDYTETDTTTITFTDGRALGESVTFLQLGLAGETNTGLSIGTGDAVYSGKSGTVLQFRSVTATNGMTTTVVSDTITVSPAFDTLPTMPSSPTSSDVVMVRKGSDGNYYKIDMSSLGAFAPTGAVLPYAGAEGAVPSYAILCDGRWVSIAGYPDLFSVIGYTYGGSGASFKVPDLRGRSAVGKDDMGGVSADRITAPWADNLGNAGGEESHILTEAEMPSHHHSTYLGREGGLDGSGSYDPPVYEPSATWVDTDDKGGDSPHNNIQPSIILNYIIIAGAGI